MADTFRVKRGTYSLSVSVFALSTFLLPRECVSIAYTTVPPIQQLPRHSAATKPAARSRHSSVLRCSLSSTTMADSFQLIHSVAYYSNKRDAGGGKHHLNYCVPVMTPRLPSRPMPHRTRPWSTRRVRGGYNAISRLHISTCTQSATATDSSRLHISTCTQSATATDSSMGKGRSAALAQAFEAGL